MWIWLNIDTEVWLRLEPIFAITRGVTQKNDAPFLSGQKWLENNYLIFEPNSVAHFVYKIKRVRIMFICWVDQNVTKNLE